MFSTPVRLLTKNTPHRYKEKKRTVPSRFELFFDVVFVAIAHQLSNVAAEQASGAGVAQFILVCGSSFPSPVSNSALRRRHSCEPFSCTLKVRGHLPALSAAQHGRSGASECMLNCLISAKFIRQGPRFCQRIRDR
jgi:hypothetical protein